MNRTVAVLCARDRSVYKSIPGCSVYDRTRDARTYNARFPVVAHPPCRLFGGLAHFVKIENPAEEIELGKFCVMKVIENGGVLEHPARSRIFEACGLPGPGQSGAGGFTIAVPQYWFGHEGRKDTWLFISGISSASELPAIPLRLEGPDRRRVEDMSLCQRETTPLALALWLVAVARQTRRCSTLEAIA